jgi:uncharacterized protein
MAYLRSSSMKINLRSFRQRVRHRRKSFRKFLNGLGRERPRGLDVMAAETDSKIWGEVDCLSCANCCRTMTPTYTKSDLRRIAGFTGMTIAEFKIKWLKKDRSTGEWLNRSTPCQFLNLENNKCNIYEVRPADCSGFPHHNKKRMVDYLHVHKQNIESCPATLLWVERMMARMNEVKVPAKKQGGVLQK